MKRILNIIKENFLIINIITIIINILLFFILDFIGLRFRLWAIITIIIFLLINSVFGISLEIYKSSDKKGLVIRSIINFIFLILLVIIYMPILCYDGTLIWRTEHTTILDNKRFVVNVSKGKNVDADFYEYHNLFLMGTTIKVHGYFGKGDFDPFNCPDAPNEVKYTYYDSESKRISEKIVDYIKDEKGRVIDKSIQKIDFDKSIEYNPNYNYQLPENEEVLYEKRFKDTILRFTKVDNTLGQRMLVHVLRSKDNGENYFSISDNYIEVSNEAQFIFLNDNLGFATYDNKIYLDQNRGLLVTTDSGKNFTTANFQYQKNNVYYLSISSLPYYDNEILKIKCKVYENKYESQELIFISKDSGLNWILENE